MIKVKDLYKVIDGEVVLDHLNMQVEEGSIYGLMGPNGAGKTTLIRHLVGVLKQNAGKIFIESQPVYENIEIKTQQQQISTINKNEKKVKKSIENEQNVYKLKAILDFNQEKVALFSINDKIYRVRQGDMVNDIKILAIGQNNLILQESTGKEIKCPLT